MTEESSATIATSGNSINLVGVPTGLLASASFNEFPIALSIRGVREAHADLFDELSLCRDLAKARQIFHNYMDSLFGLSVKHAGARRFHSSYLRLLKDWGFDANTPAGAVLKGWAESRFGLFPTFHKTPIQRFNSPAWVTYVEEKMSTRFNNNNILTQLDVLYEFSQWVLRRFVATGRKHLTLYRGTNDLREQQLVQQLDRRTAIVRLNNLVSFTSRRDIADEFGDTIIEVAVPVVKILFFNELRAPCLLRGEAEYLVIGGDYRVIMSYC
ncbi:MAG TPA: NAD(+)--dinitrogen-reductase ADP-D-ribosyltransferase [Gallionella sp.]|nr:NAD(+)--dinitrogen-reductase ADP-D-ribosyltransferase [Gallionella sp.]